VRGTGPDGASTLGAEEAAALVRGGATSAKPGARAPGPAARDDVVRGRGGPVRRPARTNAGGVVERSTADGVVGDVSSGARDPSMRGGDDVGGVVDKGPAPVRASAAVPVGPASGEAAAAITSTAKLAAMAASSTGATAPTIVMVAAGVYKMEV